MAPYSLLPPLSSISFEEKIQFSARQRLDLARSKWFTLPETGKNNSDVWSIKPPDFSLKLYRSLSVPLPQQKERQTHSYIVAPRRSETKKRVRELFLPKVLHGTSQREVGPKFLTSYKPPDALESELMFVKDGKYPVTGPYKNPIPHNFRPLDEDLPDIVTTYDRDPGNLHLKLQHMDIIRTTRSQSGLSLRDNRTKMDTYKPAESTWDARLILPLPLWPPKSASYTRHRRRRGAYSAFLDRVEEKLSRSWKNRS